MMASSKPTEFVLTAEQRALFDTAPDVPRVAAAWVLRDLGPQRPFNELLSTATMAAMESTLTFDPDKGISYAQWAFYRACHAMLGEVRADGRHYRRLRAAAGVAAASFYAQHTRLFDDFNDTDEFLAGSLRAFSDAAMATMFRHVAGSLPRPGAEEELAEREAAAYAGEALRRVVVELRPEQRELLDLHFGDDRPIKQLAREWGVGYHALREKLEGLLALVGARLRRLGITTLPPWNPEISGKVLSETPREP